MAQSCELAAVRLVYLEPLDTPPASTLPESWLARRCLGVITATDPAEVPSLLAAAPTAALMVNRGAAAVLAEEWVAIAYEDELRPIIGLDMSMSELDSAAPFIRAPVLNPIRRPGQLLWAGACRHSQGERRTTQQFTSTKLLLEWSASCAQ